MVVHIYNRIVFSHEMEKMWVSWTEVDEPAACYTEWSKSEREKHILYIKAYIYARKKKWCDEPIFRAEIETPT